MIDWKKMEELALSFTEKAYQIDNAENGDIGFASRIMAKTMAILAKQGSAYIRVQAPGDEAEIALIIQGKYPHEGLDTVLACWAGGYPLHIQSQFALNPVMKLLIDNLEGLKVRVDPAPVSKNAVIVTELLPGKDDSRVGYLSNRKALIRPPKRSLLLINEKIEKSLVKAVIPYLFQFKGQAPDNIGYIVVKDSSAIQDFVDKSVEFQDAFMHHVWMSDYDYRKSIILLNREEHMDNGWVIFRNTDAFPPLAGTVNYQVLNEIDEVTSFLMDKMIIGHNLLEDNALLSDDPAEVLLSRTAQTWVQRVLESGSFISGGINA